MDELRIGLIGNPNAGKTTLFNQLTGSRQRVGNWAGVTVERKEGSFRTARHAVRLVDLPGTYSLTTLSTQASLDEQIARRCIVDGEVDLLINVVDASNLERNLYLSVQLREMGLPCVVALNMLDIARSQGLRIDCASLAEALGCPVVPLVSTRGDGIDALKVAIDELAPQRPLAVDYPQSLHAAVSTLLPAGAPSTDAWLALLALEGDLYAARQLGLDRQRLAGAREAVRCACGDDPELLLVDARYRLIGEICERASNHRQAQPHRLTEWLDRIVLNRWLGIPVFLLVMYLMFFFAITLGGALQPIFDVGSATLFIDGIQWLGARSGAPDWLTALLAQGLGGGVNAVLPLVPQIGLMYLFLALLEDSGYMARAAFVMDRLMQALGLPGKSFVPLIVGFGCNVPSIMGTRTLDSPRERLMTCMMAPFMSCGARLAIFAVFAAAFFGQQGALAIFSLYLLGIVVAVLTGLMLKHTLMRGEASPFVMELPLYHVPHLRSLLLQTWMRLRSFVVRAGKVIILVSLVIGGLNSVTLDGRPVQGDIADSALASLSRQVTPLLAPMGVHADNWQATVGLVTGAMAKEVVVGTLNTLYTAEHIQGQAFDADAYDPLGQLREALVDTAGGLRDAFSLSVLANPVAASMADGEMDSGSMGTFAQKFGSPLAAYSYLIFVLLYVPCVTTLGALARESGRNWMGFSVFWGLNVAYSLAVLCYQTFSFAAHPQYSAVAIGLVLAFNLLLFLALRRVGQRQLEPVLADDPRPAAGGCH
ncbi:Fe(2+) transporter permease subunit FeoB [Pseudomonas citronellolis]|uniref:Fe(2+) transporter permease subunit FeoB n=1 Tax=Pseudomonas citronellolis TaxID=53408 RepID=UPI0023E461DB|nr:Fe(2+) transporter permease subunit FeoB [Pseudomonas citronellolis]MDF3936166.1 Fe(2+) transporter permease subunit FeoB [Pseudomonas citronellolis]